MSNQLIDQILRAAVEAKEGVCEEHKGPKDVEPFICGVAKGGEPFAMPDTLDGHPSENLPLLLMYLANALNDKNGTMEWEWLAYIVEGYVHEADDEDDFQRGQLERDFKNNPASAVKESMIANLYMWDGDNKVQSITYSYGDDGMPVWGEPVNAEETKGMVPFIFDSFRTFCQHEGDESKLNLNES